MRNSSAGVDHEKNLSSQINFDVRRAALVRTGTIGGAQCVEFGRCQPARASPAFYLLKRNESVP